MALTKANNRMIDGSFTNVLDFGAVGDGVADDTAAIQAALDAGSIVYMPEGTYKISDTIKLQKSGQTFFGAGRSSTPGVDGTNLVWAGPATKNAIELGRPTPNLLVSASMSDFGLTFAAGFAPLNAIFVRVGVFHSEIENLYLRPYLGDAPAEGMVKFDSDSGNSYALGISMRNVVIRADMATYTAGPVAYGIWMQSLIESTFENVRIFDTQDAWIIGDTGSNYRIVQSVNFYSCHSEVGSPRDNATPDTSGIRFNAASNLSFYGCKFNANAGLDPAANNAACLRFLTSTAVAEGSNDFQGLNFNGCEFVGFGIGDYPIRVNTASRIQDCVFESCRFVDFVEGTVFSPAPVTPQFSFTNCLFYKALFNGSEVASYAAFAFRTGAQTVPATSRIVLENNDVSAYTQRAFFMTSITGNDGKPILSSAAQQVYGNYGIEFGLFNADASSASIPADNLARIRPLLDTEIVSQSKKLVASTGVISNGAVYTTDISVPGVAFGDHVYVSVRVPEQVTSFILDGCILSAYVPAANTVRVQIMNRRGAGITLPSNLTFLACKAAPFFDQYSIVSYDAPSINNVTQLVHDVTITGASVGDFVSVSADADLQGIFVRGVVKATNTVSLFFYNETGSAVDLPAINYGIGLTRPPTSV